MSSRVLFIAPVDPNNFGYGNAAYGIYQVLVKMKKAKIIDKLSYVDISKENFDIPNDILYNTYDVAFVVAHPSRFVQDINFVKKIVSLVKQSKKKYLSVVWETDRFPNSWNTVWSSALFDGFLSPSLFVYDILRKVTEKPIFYYPHFIDINNFKLISPEEKENENIFTVLFIGQYTARKGVYDAVTGFARSLGNYPNTQLILKIHRLSKYELPPEQMVKMLYQTNCLEQSSKVTVLDQNLTLEEVNNLYHCSSLLFFPSRGEGFGLMGAESMSCGLPVIYTNWSACPEICKSPVNSPIEYYLDEAEGMVRHNYEPGLKYAIPSQTSIMNNLISYYKKWERNKIKYYEDASINRDIIDKRFGEKAIIGWLKDIIFDTPKNRVEISCMDENIISDKMEDGGKICKDSMAYMWIIRKETLFNNVSQDNVGADINHEKQVLEKLLNYCDKKTIFIDIGAHVGYYSIRVSDKVLETLAFEPNPINFNGLLINKCLNNLNNLRTYQLGIWSEKKESIIFHRGGESYIMETESVIKNKESSEPIQFEIKMERLDDIIQGIDVTHKLIIKIDTEGAELEILKSAESILKNNKVVCFIEHHENIYDNCKGQRSDIIDYMQKLNYFVKEEIVEKNYLIFEKI